MPRILLIVLSFVFAHQLNGQTWRDSVGGSYGLMLCNDGSTIAKVMPCQGWYDYSELCPGAFLSRSYDGGVHWEQETPQTGVFSDAGIVRLQGGVLRTMHSQYANVFQESRDNGLSWYPTVDTTLLEKVSGSWESGYILQRDQSGVLYWYYYGGLVCSIDNGKNYVMLPDDYSQSAREVYVVGSRRILAMLYTDHSRRDSLTTSIDYGRTWQVSVGGVNAALSIPKGLSVAVDINDTLFVRAAYPRIVADTIAGYYQRYFHFDADSNRFIPSNQNFGQCIWKWATLDSTGGLWYDSGAILRSRPEDTKCTERWNRVAPEDVGNYPNSLAYYRRSGFQDYGVFYDLDGNAHPFGSDSLQYTGTPRPISVMDRLYTCTGMEIQLGGRQITRVELDLAASRNALLQTSISANGRAALATITKRDTSQPMYIKLLAYDAELGQQVVYDSVANTPALPVVRSINVKGKVPDLEAEWKYGPFMWYRNGEPYRQDAKNSVLGMSGSSIITSLEPGTYHVVGRTDWGCLVQSNSVVVNSTSIDEYLQTHGVYSMNTQGNEISIHWSEEQHCPQRIQLYNLLGSELQAEIVLESTRAVITTSVQRQPVFVVLTTQQGVATFVVMR